MSKRIFQKTIEHLAEKYTNYDEQMDCVISTKYGKVVGRGRHKWLNKVIQLDKDVLEEIDCTLDEIQSVTRSDVQEKEAYDSACLDLSQHLFSEDEFEEGVSVMQLFKPKKTDHPRKQVIETINLITPPKKRGRPRKQVFETKNLKTAPRKRGRPRKQLFENKTAPRLLFPDSKSYTIKKSKVVSQDLFNDEKNFKQGESVEDDDFDSLFNEVLDSSYLEYLSD